MRPWRPTMLARVTGHQLRLFNSLGRRIENFAPSADVVGLYSCGPTVYSYQHLGNMRPYVFADTLRRALRWKGIPARQVVNITDVGHAVADSDTGADKLEVAAAKERRSVEEIAEFYTQDWLQALAALNVQPADVYPRASAYVDQMIEAGRRQFVVDLGAVTYIDSAGVGMLVASIAFGIVYDRVSPAAAFIMGSALSAAAAVLLLLVRLPQPHQRMATAKS